MSQPVEVYPSPNIPSQSSSHSNGSFVPVLVVLGIILFLLIISIVLGRICNRRHHRSKAEHSHGHASHKKAKNAKQNDHKFHHQAGGGGGGGGGGGDIEFGFDKRFASSKVAANGDHFNVPKIIPQGRQPKGPGPGPVRFADDHIEFRAGT